MRTEAHMLLTITAEVLDLFTDSWTLFKLVLRMAAISEEVSRLVVPWLVFYSVACVVSALSMFLKAKIFLEQVRSRRNELDLVEDESEHTRKSASHQKKFAKSSRSIRLICASFMIGIAGCLSFGVLQIIFAQYDSDGLIGTFSLVTTWW